MKFLVVDVETPNLRSDAICQIGCVALDDGIVTETYDTLVDPETYFDEFCMGVHGITPEMVESAPAFTSVWEKVKEMAEGRIFVAHNAAFDITVLSKCLVSHGLTPYTFTYTCTLQIARSVCKEIPKGQGMFKLNNLASYLGVKLEKHHDALYDSMCCAGILLKLKEKYSFDINDYIKTKLADDMAGSDEADFTLNNRNCPNGINNTKN